MPAARLFELTNEKPLDFESAANVCEGVDGNGPPDGRIPAGLTYLGQMISHDVVPSTNNRVPRPNKMAVTPCLNLDSIYGDAHFHVIGKTIDLDGKFKLGQAKGQISGFDFVYPGEDIIRNDTEEGLIPEPRNDENVLVSQLHLFWQRLHNKVVELYFSKKTGEQAFASAKVFVISIFHQVVVDDFLYQILDPEIYDLYFGQDQLAKKHRIYNEEKKFDQIPVEFSHAVFRFGHSMVRRKYILQVGGNSVNLEDLYITDHTMDLKKENVVDWSLFFGNSIKEDRGMQVASRIDLKFASPMANIPDGGFTRHIVGLNLQAAIDEQLPTALEALDWIRTKRVELAAAAGLHKSGECNANKKPFVAASCKGTRLGKSPVKKVTNGKQAKVTQPIKGLDAVNLPLWLYTLIEDNSLQQRGMKLGKLGSIIIAEVLTNSIEKANVGKLEINFTFTDIPLPTAKTKTAESTTKTKTAESTTKTKTDEPTVETKTDEPTVETKTDEPRPDVFGELKAFYRTVHRLTMLDLVKFLNQPARVRK
ncbi:MAG: hypothetical protein ACI9FJ_001203 [Alteromonadaceae bacterium]|jgi:hypothetical protein